MLQVEEWIVYWREQQFPAESIQAGIEQMQASGPDSSTLDSQTLDPLLSADGHHSVDTKASEIPSLEDQTRVFASAGDEQLSLDNAVLRSDPLGSDPQQVKTVESSSFRKKIME